MISFLNKKIKTFLLIAFIFSAFFVFVGGKRANAQTGVCEIIENGTGIRHPQGGNSGSFTITTPISSTNKPAIYVDVRTNGNCNHLVIGFVNTPPYNPSAPITLSSYVFAIDLTQSAPSWMTNGFLLSNNQDFTFSFLLGETGNYQSLNCNPPGLNGTMHTNYDCQIHVKIVAGNYDGTSTASFDEYENTSNFFRYRCSNYCSGSNIWQASTINNPIPGCPSIGPYGSSNCVVGSTVSITIPPGGGGSGVTGTGSYSEEALAPLPGFSTTPNLGGFLESLFTFMIVIAGILALIMIVVGGVTYVTTDAFSKKSDGKMYIINALTGLVLALGAWVILNTINPNLASNLGISLPEVSLTIDQQNYGDYEQQSTSGQPPVLAGTFDNPQTSPGLSQFLDGITGSNQITSISVNTSGMSMTLTSTSGSSVTIPVTGIGSQGVSEPGQGVSGDKKTPKGDWLVTGRVIAQNENDSVTSSIGGFSMGPAYIRTNISTPDGKIRGIWIHGNQSNQPGPTMGCVRIKNDDVLAIARKVSGNFPLIIN